MPDQRSNTNKTGQMMGERLRTMKTSTGHKQRKVHGYIAKVRDELAKNKKKNT